MRKSNSLEQAKQYAFGVCRLLESDPALVGEPGTSFQGKLVFPWGYGVVLANISRNAFAGTDLGNVIPPERVICQDEMVESVDARVARSLHLARDGADTHAPYPQAAV